MDFSSVDLKWCVDIFHKQGSLIPKHNHPFFHYLYIKSGRGKAVINGTELDLKPHTVYIFNPFDYHEFYAQDEYMQVYELKFDVKDAELHDRLSELDNVIKADNEHIDRLFSSLVYENNKSDELTNINKIAVFTQLAIYLLRQNVKNSEQYPKKSANPFLKIIKYMKSHYREDITLEDLASLMHIEKTYFIKQFKKHIGCSPIKYLQKLKIENAASLIENSDMNISQIAEFVGFKSIHHFSNSFKKHIGCSPSLYKENAMSYKK